MNIDTKIENGRIYPYDIDYSDVINITTYLKEVKTYITFTNNDLYDNSNLLDYTNNFKLSDCETLFSLGILVPCDYNDDTEYALSEDCEERLKELNRLNSIDTIINE